MIMKTRTPGRPPGSHRVPLPRLRRAAVAVAVAVGTMALTPAPSAYASTTFVVNSTADTAGCTVAVCTLRGAIAAANAAATEPAIITFSIPGTGPFTIAPNTQLPRLTNPFGTTIDGYTQPGAVPNSDPVASRPVLQINVVGKGAAGIEGIAIGSSNNTIRGLAIYNWRHSILLNGLFSPTGEVGNNRIVGNFICTDTTGTFKAPGVNGGAGGIILTNGAHDNIIGAPTPADRNVISGCAHRGIISSFSGTTFNKFQNNIIGLTPDGSGKLSNLAHGLDINYSANDNLIGGSGPFEHNVVSGNNNTGIEISHGSGNRRNKVIGNFIGTDLSGQASPAYAGNGQGTNIAGYGIRLEGEPTCNPCNPNAGFIEVAENTIVNNRAGGILIDKGQQWNWIHDNRIGILPDGTAAGNGSLGLRFEHGAVNNTIGPGNVIAYNAKGVQMQSTGTQPPSQLQLDTPWNRLTQNSIFSNGGTALGIDLAPYGSVNSGGVGDINVNHGIQTPVITTAITGAVSGTSCGGCVIEVYIADSAATSTLAAFGEPMTYVGSATADGAGSWSLTPTPSLTVGQPVTATATDLSGIQPPAGVPSGATTSGDTSEASRNKKVT